MKKIPQIILIEDDPRWLKRIRIVLEATNCKIEAYGKYSEKLLRRLEKKDYDLLVTDLHLGGFERRNEGQVVVEYARKLNNDIPIIVITGYPFEDVLEVINSLVEAKIDDFVAKSNWDPARLLQTVKILLKKSKKKPS